MDLYSVITEGNSQMNVRAECPLGAVAIVATYFRARGRNIKFRVVHNLSRLDAPSYYPRDMPTVGRS